MKFPNFNPQSELTVETRHLQMVLSLEGLRADGADVLALIAVCEFVFGQGTGVIESFAADGTLDRGSAGRAGLGRAALAPGFVRCGRGAGRIG